MTSTDFPEPTLIPVNGVELEVWADGALRRRSRFLRDTEARKYSDRLASRLIGRGYRKANATA